MHTISRWGRLAAVGAVAAALTACVAYPQGGYNQGAYNQGGYNQPVTSYPVTTPATSYPVQNGSYGSNSGGSYGNTYGGGYNQQGQYAQQGRVLNVETVRVQDGSGIGAGGAIVGGVLGGVLGHQVGGGRGKDLATIAGVVGGALAGHAVQNNMGGGSVRDIYRVSVQLPDGNVRAFDYQSAPDFRPGDYVRVDGNQIYR